MRPWQLNLACLLDPALVDELENLERRIGVALSDEGARAPAHCCVERRFAGDRAQEDLCLLEHREGAQELAAYQHVHLDVAGAQRFLCQPKIHGKACGWAIAELIVHLFGPSLAQKGLYRAGHERWIVRALLQATGESLVVAQNGAIDHVTFILAGRLQNVAIQECVELVV